MEDKERVIKTIEATCPRCYAKVNVDPREVFDAQYDKSYGWVCDECDDELTKICIKKIHEAFGDRKPKNLDIN